MGRGISRRFLAATEAGAGSSEDGGSSADDFDDFEIDAESLGGGGGEAFEAALSQSSMPAVGASEPAPPSSTASPQDDGIDLQPAQRMAIDLAFDGIEDKTFYEILLLPRSADDRAIKRSYYRLSKEYHPDKFYRKQLGPFKAKLELIFNKLNEAYRVLSDAETRDDYDVLVFGREGRDAASPTEATATVNFVPDFQRKRADEASAARAAKNQKVAERPRKKAAPKFLQDFQKQLAMKVARAKRHMAQGEAALQAQNFAEAASHFQMALTLDPRNTRAKAMFRRAQGSNRNKKAEEFYKRAQEAMLAEDMRRAAEFMQQAVDCKPTKGKYYNEFGKLIGEHTLQQRVGLELLRKAVELEPRNVEYTMDLARSYEELGMPSNAVRAYERVLSLDSKRSGAAKALRRLK